MKQEIEKANAELKAALQALKESEARQAGIVASAMDAIISIDVAGKITVFNAAAERMFGHAAHNMMGQGIDFLIPERYRARHVGHIQTFGKTNVTYRAMGALGAITGLRADGREFPIEASISQTGEGKDKLFTVIMRDISEKKKIEAQFLRAQRMESIGSLASGIAHDLNNILAPILLSINLLKMKVEEPGLRSVVETIESSARRGTEIVNQVLTFARGVDGERAPVAIDGLVHDMERFIRDTFPKNVTADIVVPGDIRPVTGDATQLHQLLLNLCVNARDAMPQGGGLRINAENTVLDEHYVALNMQGAPGPYVLIDVSDTGRGIPQDVLHKIFDPFFTTKEQGHGTGLGLSTVAAIAKSHGGFVNVYSEPGRGSSFRVYLPAAEASASAAPEKKGEAGVTRGHGEKILIVDDEEAVLTITKATLESCGYAVETARNGAEAVAVYAPAPEEFAVVVTDMMMPVMDGTATIAALRRINPDARIVAVSGLDTNARAARDLGAQHFLRKPYTAESLLAVLGDILVDAGSAS